MRYITYKNQRMCFLFTMVFLCLTTRASAKWDYSHVWDKPNLKDGMEVREANLIASHFFYLHVNKCGYVGKAEQYDDYYSYPIYFNEDKNPYEHPLKIYKNGGIELSGYGKYEHYDQFYFHQSLVQTTEHCYEAYNNATMLLEAIDRGDLKTVREIIELGTNIERTYPTYYGSTALVHAVSGSHLNIIQYLLERGAKIEGGQGIYSALRMAEIRQNEEVLKLLLQYQDKRKTNK